MQAQIRELIQKSGFPITNSDWEKLIMHDFGLGNIKKEGVIFIDIFTSARLRITLLVILPQQTLPQHLHPAYENELGKEETLRVLYGETKIYIEGTANNPNILIPSGKEECYTARHEIKLKIGEQFTIPPGTPHWFQAGAEGSVNLTFQNRVDEARNIFTDPNNKGYSHRS